MFRSPAKLTVLFAAQDGNGSPRRPPAATPTTYSSTRNGSRIYVSCGEGFMDVLGATDGYPRLGRVSTVAGARTALFIPELDLLALAVRARAGEPAAIWLYRPAP